MRRVIAPVALALVLVLTGNTSFAATDMKAYLRPIWDNDKILTILVIGSDAGLPRPGNPRNGRSDALHIIAVDTRKMRATIVDIPRDSLISGGKVNGHMVGGGPERTKAVLSSYTGIDIDYFALTNFRGLRLMIASMRGVKTYVDVNIRDTASKANLRRGMQKLNGSQALAFTRARKTIPGGDFGRTRHQGVLLRAVHKQLREEQSDLTTISKLLASFSRNVSTDIPSSELFRLAALAVELKPKRVKQIPLSGPTGFAGSESIVHLRPGNAFSDIRRGRIGP